MEETMVFLLLVVVMLVGSYLAGSLPLAVSMSEEKLQMVSVLGAGLLVGTALAVIIPEGVRSLGSGLKVVHVHPVTGPAAMGVGVGESEGEGEGDIYSLIGISLVLGFVFMLLVDQCSNTRTRDIEGAGKGERNITATLGLVVHAAADGVALGAAAKTAQADVEMIVFLAIMLHKAPAAFGLVTFLLHEGVERNRVRRHLLVFSCSAPLLAVLTFFCIGQEGKETLSAFNATGIAMLFSAGTFLYVATVHVLPELTSRGGHGGHGGAGGDKGLSCTELLCLVVGALLPLLLTLGHHHH